MALHAGRFVWRPWFLSLAITVTIFGYFFQQVDLSEIFSTARQLTPRFVIWFVVLLLIGSGASALRFWVLLNRSVSIRVLLAVTLARNLFVDLLPARLGELSYVYFVTHRAGRPLEEGIASLLLALLFDIVALAPLLIIAVLTVTNQLPTGWIILASLVLAVIALGIIWISGPIAMLVATGLDNSRQGSQRAWIVMKLRETAKALARAQERGAFLPVFGLSIIVRLCKFGSYFFLVLSIMEPLGYTADSLGFFRVFLGVVSAELAAALPIHGIAGFGTYEAVWSFSFTRLGLSQEHAIISGILTHAISQVIEYALGACAFLYLMRPGFRKWLDAKNGS